MTVVRITLMMGIFCYGLHAQEAPIAATDRTPPAKEVFDDDGSRVAVLGYHVFHKTLPATQMRIPTSKFRSQMEAIRKSNIAVITLEQFLAWRRGEGELPPQSILITMDDGWRSV